jgi:hypothetical protein
MSFIAVPGRRFGRSAIARGLVLAGALAAGPFAHASGVDGAGRIVVVPLVFNGRDRQSMITLTNGGGEPITLATRYVGADQTPHAGLNPCDPVHLAPVESVTISLSKVCNLPPPDIEDFGYLEFQSSGDSRITFFATSIVWSNGSQETSSIIGEPIGAFTPGWPNSYVLGLRTEGPGSPSGEKLTCFVGAFDLDKTIMLELADGANTNLGTLFGVKVPARHMVAFDMAGALGLPAAARDNLHLLTGATDNASAVVGCAMMHPSTLAVAWQPAQSDAARDVSRLHVVDVHSELLEGPYHIGSVWTHSLIGGSGTLDRKVTLSTYLQADDALRCFVERDPNFTDWSPWLELQVRAPDGTVVAGGNGARDTGIFQTGARGFYKPSLGNRWYIDISLDEDAFKMGGTPHQDAGAWGLHCESAAGMSEPIGVPAPTGINTDNF